jgi:hypothetical protein
MGPGSFVLSLVACGVGPVEHAGEAPSPLLGPVVAVEPVTPVAIVEESLPAPEPESETASLEVAVYTLRRGESLAHFARWSGLPVEDIAELSGLSLDELLPVGVAVHLPLDAEGRAQLEAERDAHHLRRAEAYITSRGGSVGTEFHRVRTGESAWTVAKDNARIPVWLLETYNPSVDLENLRPGMELMLPVLADSVAAAANGAELEPGWE